MRDQTWFVENEKLKYYKHRICVAGTRGFSDYAFFTLAMQNYLKELGYPKEEILFISGDATSGADAMIIKFAIEFGYYWTSFKADWDNLNVEGARIKVNPRTGKEYNALAGFQRNEEMAEVLTRLVTFYDGVSPGTRDMIKRVNEDNHPIWVVIVDMKNQPKENHETKPSSSRSGNPPKDRSHLAGWS